MLPFYGFGKQLSGNATLTGVDAPVESTASGTPGSNSLTATNPSFAAGRFILILNMRGAYVTTGEVNQIQSYVAGTITTVNKLLYNYDPVGQEKAQVIQLPEYGVASIASTYFPKAWDGTTGGVLAFIAQETLINGGTAINGTGRGFRKGDSVNGSETTGKQGEGTTGAGNTQSISANGNGGGGGGAFQSGGAAGGSGAGGGNGTAGAGSFTVGTSGPAVGGGVVGNAALTQIAMGGGGGGGGTRFGSPESSGQGGNGGAIVIIFTRKITVGGGIHVGGDVGTEPSRGGNGAGGGGAGGSILIRAVEANIGTNLLTALGGSGGVTPGAQEDGGNGGNGRIRVEACKITGTTNQGEVSLIPGGHNWCGSLIDLVE